LRRFFLHPPYPLHHVVYADFPNGCYNDVPGRRAGKKLRCLASFPVGGDELGGRNKHLVRGGADLGVRQRAVYLRFFPHRAPYRNQFHDAIIAKQLRDEQRGGGRGEYLHGPRKRHGQPHYDFHANPDSGAGEDRN
jgi:hypothetical protein